MAGKERSAHDTWACPVDTHTRTAAQLYPDFTAEMEALCADGVCAETVRKIIAKHAPNAAFNRGMYRRYAGIDVPIYHRRPRFAEEANAINNHVASDFFGDIVDFFTGYFAGKPIGYSYSVTAESQETTGALAKSGKPVFAGDKGPDGEGAVAAAAKVLTDFVARNNMMDVDMETAKYAAVCGYAARLFYHDSEGDERVMVVPPFEVAILARADITEPVAAVQYFMVPDEDGEPVWHAEYYDDEKVVLFCGASIDELDLVEERAHLFDFCPLQGIPKNGEMMGDAEKVLHAIDAYDRALSDASNDIEAFASAYMIFDNVNISDEEIEKGQRSGAFRYFNGGSDRGAISFLTKDVNDAFVEHHLDRLENNIYRFSKTPNLSDERFAANASGVAMKYKLLGLETKSGIFQAKMQSAGTYMFKLLASSWAKRQIPVDPLQCSMEFHRNFPLDLASEAQAVQHLVLAGVPERVAYSQLSFIEDVDWVMQLKVAEEGEDDGAR